MRPAFLSILLSLCASIILAQNDDDNVLITNKQNNFIFENSKNGIIVKETAVTNFEASKMSETVSFFEFYNNEVEINSIKIKGIKNVKPASSFTFPMIFSIQTQRFAISNCPSNPREKPHKLNYRKL